MIYWHWEAMLISYLATRVIVLPFNSIPELLDKSDFLIALNPGLYLRVLPPSLRAEVFFTRVVTSCNADLPFALLLVFFFFSFFWRIYSKNTSVFANFVQFHHCMLLQP
jgi:hypothetical protein